MKKVNIVSEEDIIALQKELGVRAQYIGFTMFGIEFTAIKQDRNSLAALAAYNTPYSVYTIPAKYFEDAIESKLSRDEHNEEHDKFRKYFPLYGNRG